MKKYILPPVMGFFCVLLSHIFSFCGYSVIEAVFDHYPFFKYYRPGFDSDFDTLLVILCLICLAFALIGEKCYDELALPALSLPPGAPFYLPFGAGVTGGFALLYFLFADLHPLIELGFMGFISVRVTFDAWVISFIYLFIAHMTPFTRNPYRRAAKFLCFRVNRISEWFLFLPYLVIAMMLHCLFSATQVVY